MQNAVPTEVRWFLSVPAAVLQFLRNGLQSDPVRTTALSTLAIYMALFHIRFYSMFCRTENLFCLPAKQGHGIRFLFFDLHMSTVAESRNTAPQLSGNLLNVDFTEAVFQVCCLFLALPKIHLIISQQIEEVQQAAKEIGEELDAAVEQGNERVFEELLSGAREKGFLDKKLPSEEHFRSELRKKKAEPLPESRP